MPTAPAPGLPFWASASRDLVPATCLPPVLPSSSSAPLTPSPKVGGLCVPAMPGALLVWLCVSVSVSHPCFPALSSRPAPGSAPCRWALAGWHRGWHSTSLWSGSCVLTVPLCPRRVHSNCSLTVFLLLLFTLSFFPSLLPQLPVPPPIVACLTLLQPSPPFPSPRPTPDGGAAAPCCRLRAVVPGADGRAGDRPRCSLPALLSPASARQSFPAAAGLPL